MLIEASVADRSFDHELQVTDQIAQGMIEAALGPLPDVIDTLNAESAFVLELGLGRRHGLLLFLLHGHLRFLHYDILVVRS